MNIYLFFVLDKGLKWYVRFFWPKKNFLGVYNEYITKLARNIKWNARNLNDQNLYNPVGFFYFFLIFNFFQKKAHDVCAFNTVTVCAVSYLTLHNRLN